MALTVAQKDPAKFHAERLTGIGGSDAASILGVISLGAEKGDYVTLVAEGENANAVLDALAELLTTDHDEN